MLLLSQIHLQDLWNCFQFVLNQNPHHFKEIYLNAEGLSNPQQSFGNPLQAMFMKIEIFSATVK